MTQNVILALQWTLATAGALALTPVVGEIVFLLVAGDRVPLWAPLASVAVLGFAVGAAQSVIVRRFGPSPVSWILVTGAAFGVASSMGNFLVGGLLAGAITGAALPIIFSVPAASPARAQRRQS